MKLVTMVPDDFVGKLRAMIASGYGAGERALKWIDDGTFERLLHFIEAITPSADDWKDKPAEPGYYFFQGDLWNSTSTFRPIIVDVIAYGAILQVMTFGDRDYTFVHQWHGQWHLIQRHGGDR